jgi:hypothetical protein
MCHVTRTTCSVAAPQPNWHPSAFCLPSVCLLLAGLPQHVVFVWDADDTLVPLHSLVNGQYSVQAGGGLEGSSASALGRKLQGLVLQLADAHMHFKEVRIHTIG